MNQGGNRPLSFYTISGAPSVFTRHKCLRGNRDDFGALTLPEST